MEDTENSKEKKGWGKGGRKGEKKKGALEKNERQRNEGNTARTKDKGTSLKLAISTCSLSLIR